MGHSAGWLGSSEICLGHSHRAGGEMERHEQGRGAADVHSKHSIYPTFILMEGLVKTGVKGGNRRWRGGSPGLGLWAEWHPAVDALFLL